MTLGGAIQNSAGLALAPRDAGPSAAASAALSAGRVTASRAHDGDSVLRILHVLNRLDTGGTELVVLSLVRGLNTGQFESRICVTRGFNPGMPALARMEAEPYVAGEVDAGSQFLFFRLAKIMKDYRPHIVHSRNWGAIEAIPAARFAGVPVVIHSEHGYEVDMISGISGRRRLLRRAVYPMADAIFAVTEELRAYHAQQAWYSPEKIRVLHNGVDTRRFAPLADCRDAVRRSLNLSAGSFVVGSVGRMVAIKDYTTLLKAAAAAAARGVDIQVLLAGAGPELETYRKAAAALPELAGRVRFPGATEQVPGMLNAMDAFVLPSLLEGMSNTILEAMACGLPVVATNVGGNPELVKDGVTGWVFPAGHATELANRLEQLGQDGGLRVRFGRAARERALNEFSLEAMIRRYEDLYLELAERRQAITVRKA